jgi:hypothetical protein
MISAIFIQPPGLDIPPDHLLTQSRPERFPPDSIRVNFAYLYGIIIAQRQPAWNINYVTIRDFSRLANETKKKTFHFLIFKEIYPKKCGKSERNALYLFITAP